MAFMKEYKLIIDIGENALLVRDRKILFNNQSGNPKVSLLRAEINCVVFPGDTVEVPVPANFKTDAEVAVEARDNASWPFPCIVDTKGGFVNIPNDTDKPVKLKANQVIGQIRSVITPPEVPLENVSRSSITQISQNTENNVKKIKLDPDHILTQSERLEFNKVNNEYASRFSSKIGIYNGKSGQVFADVLLGKNVPVPKKGRTPSYSSNKNVLLQEKFDELVELGVLKRPEDLGVTVVHTSSWFIVKSLVVPTGW